MDYSFLAGTVVLTHTEAGEGKSSTIRLRGNFLRSSCATAAGGQDRNFSNGRKLDLVAHDPKGHRCTIYNTALC
jgi:hypothetical protein